MLSADDIIARLGLAPHPEGGWFAETFRDGTNTSGRSHGTAIYYLLKAGERSHWHRVDAAEIWHWYAGDPLALHLSPDGKENKTFHLGADLARGQRPQLVVPAQHWQAAEPLGAYTLVGCTVSPGFDFAGFEMAPKDWKPGK
ncbi:MAG: cupin domain-containing protein [Parvibaculum sp.]|nr:cupin domain-containing protein [Parvibaculum sp.]